MSLLLSLYMSISILYIGIHNVIDLRLKKKKKKKKNTAARAPHVTRYGCRICIAAIHHYPSEISHGVGLISIFIVFSS